MRRRREASPTRSVHSTDRVNPEAPGWTKRRAIYWDYSIEEGHNRGWCRMGGCGSIDEDQSARTLGAAALDLVDQDINHPGLFEGGFDQARSLLSRLREGDVGCKT